MIKTIKVSDKESFVIDTSVWWMFIYRQQFGKDILPDLLPFMETALKVYASIIAPSGNTDDMGIKEYAVALANDENLEEAFTAMIGAEVITIYQIAWALAKNADSTIPEPQEWFKKFENLPMDIIGKEVIEAIIKSTVSEKNAARLLKRVNLIALI